MHRPWSSSSRISPHLALACLPLLACAPLHAAQPELGAHSKHVITVGKLQFRDLNGNGKLDPYEDWRLGDVARAKDLLGRMSLEEKAGLMIQPMAWLSGSLRNFTGYNFDWVDRAVEQKHAHFFLTKLTLTPQELAVANNRLQEVGERSRLGIPIMVSSDPRNSFLSAFGISSRANGSSLWPEPIGLGALGDVDRVREFGDAVRQEYRAVGLTEALSPQADVATEPRWTRISGTFGSDAASVSALAGAYVEGVQGGPRGLARNGVAAVVKHFAGYGAELNGIDGHFYAGRFAVLSGNSLQLHINAFRGALQAHAAGVLPAYPILRATLDGVPLEPVAPGFSRQMLTGVLRDKLKYQGFILSDWQITDNCDAACRNEGPDMYPGGAGFRAAYGDMPADEFFARLTEGKPWGMEDATPYERFVKAIQAGVDQFGGTEDSDLIVRAVREGRVSEKRLDQSVLRLLVPMFHLGLFENPYVDPDRAGEMFGGAFMARAQLTQREAQVLLTNHSSLIPVAPGRKVFLYGIDADAARAAGLTVVDQPSEADFALIGSPMPKKGLEYTAEDPSYAALLRASALVPTIFAVTLERPAILTDVNAKAAAILVNFGSSDAAILDDVMGKAKPRGRLPFELPSSMQAVEAQDPALPDDSKSPLFPRGAGIVAGRPFVVVSLHPQR